MNIKVTRNDGRHKEFTGSLQYMENYIAIIYDEDDNPTEIAIPWHAIQEVETRL